MAHWNKLSFIGAIVAVFICAAPSARAADPPPDLCSLLPAADLSKITGESYSAPQKTVAPRPFPNTVEGADCVYKSSKGSRLLLRLYADPSPAAATDLFTRLSKYFSPPKPVSGVGDQAYFDPDHGLHVRKGRVRYYIQMHEFSEKLSVDIARQIAGRL